MKAISGEPLRDKYALPPSQSQKQYDLDFLYSNDLAEIEEGIKETFKGVNFANFGLCMAFAKIDREALYLQAGHKSYLQYLDQAEDRLNMSRKTMSDYKRMGEAYLDHKADLQLNGFKGEGHLHKLRYLEQALKIHDPDEVFQRIANDPFRRFRDYATGESPSERSDTEPVLQYVPDIQITPERIVVDGKNILNFPGDLDERTKEELADYLKQIYEVRATGNRPYVFSLYDENEARAVERYLRRHRREK